MAPGTEVELTIVREGEEMTIPVVLAELPGQASARSDGSGQSPGDVGPDATETLRQFGLEGVGTFTEALADRLGTTYEPGVLVTSVRPGSVAHIEGIIPARESPLLITKVMTTPVASVEELSAALAELEPTDPIRVRVKRWEPREKQFIASTRVLELPE